MHRAFPAGAASGEPVRRRIRRWENVALDAGGLLASDACGFVVGLHYGPDQDEVGYIFERQQLFETFGVSMLPSAAPMSH